MRAQGRNNHRAADAPIGSEGESWSGSTRNLPPWARSFLRGSNGYQLPRPLAKSILRELYTSRPQRVLTNRWSPAIIIFRRAQSNENARSFERYE